MSLERVEQVKKRKPFALWDILVYGILAAFILILFIVFVFTADTSPISGIKIYVKEEVVFTYEFGGKEEIATGWEERVTTVREENEYFVTVRTERGYNTVAIDLVNKSAKMRDTDCDRLEQGKQCLLEQVTNNSEKISCLPHFLFVRPLDGEEDFDHPTIG